MSNTSDVVKVSSPDCSSHLKSNTDAEHKRRHETGCWPTVNDTWHRCTPPTHPPVPSSPRPSPQQHRGSPCPTLTLDNAPISLFFPPILTRLHSNPLPVTSSLDFCSSCSQNKGKKLCREGEKSWEEAGGYRREGIVRRGWRGGWRIWRNWGRK